MYEIDLLTTAVPIAIFVYASLKSYSSQSLVLLDLQLHSKSEDVLDLRASGWEDNKVVITPDFTGSAGLLLLYVFSFSFGDPNIYKISQYEPDDLII